MSLIVTSSTQEQYGGLNATRTLTGIEDPAAYSNHFKSPLELPIDAEIAVESVKIRRGALFDIEDDSVMYQYFGKEQTLVGRAGKQERVSMPIPITPNRGVYSVGEFAEELEKRLDESYGNPEIFGGHSVDRQTDGAGTVTGFSMSTVQKGNASLAAQDRKAIMSGLRDTGVGLEYWSGLRSITDGAPGITATATATSAVITRTAATSPFQGHRALDDRKASIIGTKFPMGLVQGLFWVETKKASKGWRVGLSRQQLEFQRNSVGPAGGAPSPLPDDPNFVQVAHLGIGKIGGGDLGGEDIKYGEQNIISLLGQSDYYDYMVENDGENIRMYQVAHDTVIDQFVQTEVYYNSPSAGAIQAPETTAAWDAAYDGLYFYTVGDEVQVWGSIAGKPFSDAKLLLGSTISKRKNRCFAPIGETRTALFPRLNILEKDELLTVRQYSSWYGDDSYRSPTYDADTFTLTTGDDYYSNNRVARFGGSNDNTARIIDTKERPYSVGQTQICDAKDVYSWNTDELVRDAASQQVEQVFAGTISVGGIPQGVGHKQVRIIGRVKIDSKDDYLEGQYSSLATTGQANLNNQLGFKGRSLLKESSTAGYVVGAGTPSVIFSSHDVPLFRFHSAFVRISNLTQSSFNGAKQSVSKIVYHLPRFSDSGKEFGELFLSSNEKTYVKLNNTSIISLNQLDIQIVDVNEIPVDDLSGGTIVVFHVRKAQ